MSAYAQSLSDIDLGGIWSDVKAGVTKATDEVVTQAETATKEAAAGLVRSGKDAVSQQIDKLVGGGSNSQTTPALPVTQSTEKPVVTTNSTLSGLGKYAVPGAVGVGVFLWKKSILWAAGAALAAFWIAGRMRKGGR